MNWDRLLPITVYRDGTIVPANYDNSVDDGEMEEMISDNEKNLDILIAQAEELDKAGLPFNHPDVMETKLYLDSQREYLEILKEINEDTK